MGHSNPTITWCCLLLLLLLLLLLCAPTSAQEDEQARFNRLVDRYAETPDGEGQAFQNLNVSDRINVAAELLRREKRVSEAALVLADQLDNDDGFRRLRWVTGNVDDIRDVFASLGPNNRDRSLGPLLEWLGGDDPRLARLAGEALAEFEVLPVETIEVLIDYLDRSMPPTREWSCRLLRTFGSAAERSLSQLRVCLKDSDPKVRFQAAASVSRLDPTDRECVRVLSELFTSHDDLRWDAIRQLAEIGPRAVEAADAILPLLTDRDKGKRAWFSTHRGSSDFKPGLRKPVQEVLDAMGRRQAIPVLQRWLAKDDISNDLRHALKDELVAIFSTPDPDPTDWNSVRSLARGLREPKQTRLFGPSIAGTDQITAAVINRIDSPLLLTCWLAIDSSDFRRKRIMRRLAEFENEATLARSVLAQVIASSNDDLQFTALWTLTNIGPVDAYALRPLVDSKERLRLKTVEALGHATPASREEAIRLLKKLKQSGLVVQLAAYTSLHRLGKPDANTMSVLREAVALKHRSEDETLAILRTIRQLGPEASEFSKFVFDLPPNETGYSPRDINPFEAERTMAALGKQIVPKLIERLGAAESLVRKQAIVALGMIGPPARKALPFLIKNRATVYGRDSDEAFEAARAIAAIAKEGDLALIGIRRALNGLSMRAPTVMEQDFPDLILELGPVSKQLVSDLAHIVEKHEFIHVTDRISAAYVLAIIDPNEPRWRTYLKLRATNYHMAERRLQELPSDSRP